MKSSFHEYYEKLIVQKREFNFNICASVTGQKGNKGSFRECENKIVN